MGSKFYLYVQNALFKSEPELIDQITTHFSENFIVRDLEKFEKKKYYYILHSTPLEDSLDSHSAICFMYRGTNLELLANTSRSILINALSDLLSFKSFIELSNEGFFNEMGSIAQKKSALIFRDISDNDNSFGKQQDLLLKKLSEAHDPSTFKEIVNDFSFKKVIIRIRSSHEVEEGEELLALLGRGLFVVGKTGDLNQYRAYVACLIVSFEKFLIIEKGSSNDYLKDCFLALNLPVAVIDSKDSLLIHNTAFNELGLNLKEIQNLKDMDLVKKENREELKVYKRVVSEDRSDLSFLVFMKTNRDQHDFSSNTKELGIITSSMAHELNNPLGGIMAAIDVILLDDLEPEVNEKLEQMKEGVKRCKQLVETFLGFSKKSQSDFEERLSFEAILNQVFILLRFRLVESNINLTHELSVKHKLSLNCNPYALIIIIYLVLGDIITGVSRKELITGQKDELFVLKVIENKSSFSLSLNNDLSLSKGFFASKFLALLKKQLGLNIVDKKEHLVFNF